MRRAALLVSLIAAVVLGGPAAAQEHAGGAHGSAGGAGAAAGSVATNDARVGFAAMVPADLDIVAGEAVRWSNDSARVHTVTADDGSFDSGRMSAAATFAHRFPVAGVTPYRCTLHPLIQGEVWVTTSCSRRPRWRPRPAAPSR